MTRVHEPISKNCPLQMWSSLQPRSTGRTKAQRLVDLSWKVALWHKVRPFKPNPLLFRAASFFYVQICISKCRIWSRNRYFVIDSDPKKRALLFCVTPEKLWVFLGMYLCFVFSVNCICLASGGVNIEEVHKRSSYLFSHAGSKQKYSFCWITQMHCLALVLTNHN